MMVQLFARVTRLLARAAHSNTIITESDAPISLSNLTPSSNSSSGSPPSLLDVGLANLQSSIPLIPFGAADPLVLEARQLMGDVDAWIDSLRLTTLEHERVQVGNRAYAHAMKVGLAVCGVAHELINRSCCSETYSNTLATTLVYKKPLSKY